MSIFDVNAALRSGAILAFVFLSSSFSFTAKAADTDPPSFVSSVPPSDATGVPVATVVQFNFSEAMKPQQAIFWIGLPNLLDTNKIGYMWSADKKSLSCTYTGGWPGGDVINWALSPSIPAVPPFFPGLAGFEDLAGNPLDGESATGTFQTAVSTGGGDPTTSTNSCGQVSTNKPQNVFSVAVLASYQQNDPNQPLPFSESEESGAFQFTASVSLRAAGSATSIGVRAPSGSDYPLMNLFGNYLLFTSSNTLAALQARFAPGAYHFANQGATGIPASVDVTLPSLALPIIHISNFAEAQAVNSTQAFTLRWDPLGVPASNPLTVSIYDEMSGAQVLRSPDFGCPGALNGQSTSWTIPAGTLSADHLYRAEVDLQLFGQPVQVNANTVAFAGYNIQTRSPLKTAGGTTSVDPFRITDVRFTTAVELRFRVEPTASGHIYRLERRAISGATWTAVNQATATSTTTDLFDTHSPASGGEFYRVVAE